MSLSWIRKVDWFGALTIALLVLAGGVALWLLLVSLLFYSYPIRPWARLFFAGAILIFGGTVAAMSVWALTSTEFYKRLWRMSLLFVTGGVVMIILSMVVHRLFED